MLLELEDTNNRLSSVNNLINRMKIDPSKSFNKLELFGVPEVKTAKSEVIGIPKTESPEEIQRQVESEMRNGLIKQSAKAVLGDSLIKLQQRLPEVDKPEKLSRIATDMSKILDVLEPRSNDVIHGQQVIVYRPVMNTINSYESMHVSE